MARRKYLRSGPCLLLSSLHHSITNANANQRSCPGALFCSCLYIVERGWSCSKRKLLHAAPCACKVTDAYMIFVVVPFLFHSGRKSQALRSCHFEFQNNHTTRNFPLDLSILSRNFQYVNRIADGTTQYANGGEGSGQPVAERYLIKLYIPRKKYYKYITLGRCASKPMHASPSTKVENIDKHYCPFCNS